MPELLITLLGKILPDVVARVLPPEKISEADSAKLQAELTNQIMAQDWQQIAAEYADRNSARNLAAQEIAKGNALTASLAALVRPAWGFGALALVAWNVLGAHQIDTGLQSIVNTVLMFYFGGRVIEKVTPHIAESLKK